MYYDLEMAHQAKYTGTAVMSSSCVHIHMILTRPITERYDYDASDAFDYTTYPVSRCVSQSSC